MEETSRGILLSATPYLGQKKILKVFTAEFGLMTLMAKSSKQTQLTAPFCIGEWVYRKSQREIYPLVDGSLLDPLDTIRSSYDILTGAGAMANDLLRSQLPLKPSLKLYDLLSLYLRKIAESSHPHSIAASFRIKLLLHDGLLSLRPDCARCGEPASCIAEGESYCTTHGIGGIDFAASEWDLLLLLGYGRQFSILNQVDATDALLEKTKGVFQERMN